MTAVDYRTDDGVAVLAMNNPPVNGLGAALRAGLADGLEKGLADSAVTALVLIGSGRMFSAGADIREFGHPPAEGVPQLPELIDRIEAAIRRSVDAGDPNAIAISRRTGGIEKYDRRRRWWTDHHDQFAAALL